MVISIVSPVYYGESMVRELVERVIQNISSVTLEYEIILVNDASPDNSWNAIKHLCNQYPNVKGVNLSKNFGQHAAITAGLSVATGEWVVVMDCDLQDRPEEIPILYNKALEGYDCVIAQRVCRKDKFLKRLSSTIFNSVFTYLTDTYKDKTVANFGIYRKKVIDSVLSMGDYIKSFPSEISWVGYNTFKMPVEHSHRAYGKSSYTLSKLLRFAFDNMVAFSNKPLKIMVQFGFGIVIISFLLAFYYFFKYLLGDIDVSGFTTLVISIWMSTGLLIMFIGIVGIYIGKIFDQVKDRPVFIISETVNI